MLKLNKKCINNMLNMIPEIESFITIVIVLLTDKTAKLILKKKLNIYNIIHQ